MILCHHEEGPAARNQLPKMNHSGGRSRNQKVYCSLVSLKQKLENDKIHNF